MDFGSSATYPTGTNGNDSTVGDVAGGRVATPADSLSSSAPEIPLSADEADFEFSAAEPVKKDRSQADARSIIRDRACAVMERYPEGCTCSKPGAGSKLCNVCDRFFRAAKLVLALDGQNKAKAAADEDDEDGDEPQEYDGKWAAEHIAKLNRKQKPGGKKDALPKRA